MKYAGLSIRTRLNRSTNVKGIMVAASLVVVIVAMLTVVLLSGGGP